MQQLQTADGVESFPRPKRPRELSPTHVLKEREGKWDSTCGRSPGPSSGGGLNPLAFQKPGLQDGSPPPRLKMSLELLTHEAALTAVPTMPARLGWLVVTWCGPSAYWDG